MKFIYSILITLIVLVGLWLFSKDQHKSNIITKSNRVDTQLIDVDFEQSNGFNLLEKYNIPFSEQKTIVNLKLNLLKNNYEQLKPSKMEFKETSIIPKMIHIIWLGNSSLPQNFQYYIETWRKFHPTWEIKVWNEEMLKKENFSSYDLYMLAESYAERTDIMRYEILYRYGGLYIDTDIECIANFDEFHHKYDFYINLEPPIINKGTLQVVNAMIGSIPNNPIFIEALEKIRSEWKNNTSLFLKHFASYPTKRVRSKHHLAVRRTMIPFSDVVFDFLSKQNLSSSKSIILPIGYNMPFYPSSDDYSYKVEIQPETRSIHHYDKSNSLMQDPGFTKSLFDFNIILNDRVAIFKSQKYLFLNLQDLFQENFPSKIPFNKAAEIPENIYLLNSGHLDKSSLQNLYKDWQRINPFAKINFISNEELLAFIPKKFKALDQETIKLIARFYLLETLGGIFVETNFKPANLQEFNYKYKFYAQLNTVQKPEDSLDLAMNFIASKKNHVIISHVIQDIEEVIEKEQKLASETIKDIFLQNIYKYNLLDNKNIIFPENIFAQKR